MNIKSKCNSSLTDDYFEPYKQLVQSAGAAEYTDCITAKG